MKKLFLAGLLLALVSLGGVARAQDQALVVSSCGSPSVTYPAGQTRLPTVDTNGKLCISNSIGATLESFGASPSASASTNVAAFQAAFDSTTTGTKWLTTCGTYQLNATVYFDSNLDFEMSDCVKVIRTAADINLFQSKSTLATPTTVTLAWTSGVTVTMTWTGHGQSVNSPICVRGTDQSVFNGPFLVVSVTDANTITYRTESLPSTGPTGTTQVIPCTQNVRIAGGTIDYNYPNVTMNSTPGVGNTAIRFGFAYNVRTENLTIINGGIFGINCGSCRDFRFVNTKGTINAGEFIKIYGPAYGGVIDGVSGITADDGTSIQTKEFAIYSANYRWTFGDVLGVQIRNVTANSGTASGSSTAIYFTANERMDNVVVSNVNGNAASPSLASGLVYITSENLTDTAGQITLEHIRGWSTYSPIRFDKGTIENLIVDDIGPAGVGAITLFQNTGIISFGGTTAIRNAHISNLIVPVGVTWSGGLLAGVLNNAGELDNITVDSPQSLSLGRFSALWNISGSIVGNVTLNNPAINSTDAIVQTQAGVTGALTVNVNGGYVSAADSLVYSGSSATININGVNMGTIANGVVSADHTPTLNITGQGNILASGAWTHTFANSPVYRLYVNTNGGTSALAIGETQTAKISASGVAPGAGFAKFSWVAGTNAGTCKLISYAGTSTTPVTIVDNVGTGC